MTWPARPPRVAIGQVTAPQGLGGQVRIRVLGDFPERFRPGLELFIQPESPSVPGRWTRVEDVRTHRRGLVLSLEGIGSRSEAEALRGARLEVPWEDRHPLPEDTFYVDDLVGMPVLTPDGSPVGHVRDVLPGAAQDLLVVGRGEDSALVPLTRALVQIQPEEGRIVVEPLPGLLSPLIPDDGVDR